MKHVCLVYLLGSLSVVSLTTATARAAPAEEAPSRAAETGKDQDEEP